MNQLRTFCRASEFFPASWLFDGYLVVWYTGRMAAHLPCDSRSHHVSGRYPLLDGLIVTWLARSMYSVAWDERQIQPPHGAVVMTPGQRIARRAGEVREKSRNTASLRFRAGASEGRRRRGGAVKLAYEVMVHYM